MKIVRISIEACGYYSDASYIEDLFITKETFDKVKEGIEAIKIYISDLDGKYSEVQANLSIHEYTEEDLLKYEVDFSEDGDDLYWKLKSIFDRNGLDLDSELEVTQVYIDSLDKLKTVEFRVRQSQIKLVEDFIENLNNKGAK